MALSKEAKASIIAAAVTFGLALLVLAIIFIVQRVSKKKEEGKEKAKDGDAKKESGKEKDKEKDKTKNKQNDDKIASKPKTITRTYNGQKVVGVLGEDGAYHIKASQLISKNGLQDSLTKVKSKTNASVSTTIQKQEDFNSKFSNFNKQLEEIKAQLAEQRQQNLQPDKIADVMNAVIPNVVNALSSKLDELPMIKEAPKMLMANSVNKSIITGNDSPAAPILLKDAIAGGIEPKIIKQEVKTSLEAANKAKEEAKGNAL